MGLNKFIVGLICVCMIGCSESDKEVIKRSNELRIAAKSYERALISLREQYETAQAQLAATKTAIAVKDGSAIYIVEVKVSQSHFSLDLGDHFKDAMNVTSFEMIVDKRYYDTLTVGQTLNSDFRMGSAIISGSIGSWNIVVSNKRVGH